ncbi:MAG: F0F1 ATP synthase subunit beta, partial [Nitrospinae bacterium]|nr:F0F1 ATP synthase subunit beta [Nitrospinota bacterium]
MMSEAIKTKGKITQIIGPAVDFRFPHGSLPEQGNAIHLKREDGTTLVFETMQHLGN